VFVTSVTVSSRQENRETAGEAVDFGKTKLFLVTTHKIT
jgi:hypothetical protein